MTIRILPGNLADHRVLALLDAHVTRARAETGAGSAHALDHTALTAPEISLWTAWDGDELLAVGAIRRLDASHGEIKSMYVAEAARRRGAGGAILDHLISTARDEGMSRLSLETGAWPYFQPAHALYQARGFRDCEPFGDYRVDPNSRFMTLPL